MDFDEMQSKWQSHDYGKQLNIDAKVLLDDIRRSHRTLELQLWRRDLSEVVASALITCVFASLAVFLRHWSLLLCAAGSLLVGLVFIFDRLKQRHRRLSIEDSLQSAIEASLTEVQHQIWLLRNILWWYLLPLVPGIVAFLVSTSRESLGNGIAEQLVIAFVGLICAIAFWQVYWINQREVEKTLEPRRIELEELRSSLK